MWEDKIGNMTEDNTGLQATRLKSFLEIGSGVYYVYCRNEQLCEMTDS